MDQLLKFVKTYRVVVALGERLRLAEDIFRVLEPELRIFVFASTTSSFAEDVLQDILKAIATDLGKFKGGTEKQFWAWCYRIARNKLNDHFRKQSSYRECPIVDDELWQLVEETTATERLSPADRHDLQYAMDLLRHAKPECFDF